MSVGGPRPARPPSGGGRGAPRPSEAGSLSLESVLVLPVLAVLVSGLLGTVTILRDVLLLHEAVRAGARVAATTADNASVDAEVRAAAPELDGLRLEVSPPSRVAGDVVTVSASARRRLGPTTLRLSARAHARVEPGVDAGANAHPWWQPDPARHLGPRAPWTSDPGEAPAGEAPARSPGKAPAPSPGKAPAPSPRGAP